ncbi:AraC family transcriptional regulator [Marinospirillum perlucidum]|uniref:AraC family transcriptional regulator n=1 Tax=Marinospirillum perlucidum TaxID=1982602 RepID=UPI000DF3AACE|nr:AraC family transcriptional regulator [Marinospirillum perlucidum]
MVLEEFGRKAVELIQPRVEQQGFTPTPLPGITLVHGRSRIQRTPLLYEPSLVILAQGHKTGYLGDRIIEYHPGQYLVQTLPLPFECETHASPEEPLYGVCVRLDPALLSELVTARRQQGREAGKGNPLPMDSVPMTERMAGATLRLLEALQDPAEIQAMGQARVRDLVFESLNGEQGPALEALVLNQGHYARIARVLSELHADLAAAPSVEALAQSVNMSVSSFHQHFREITRTSPVQYLKRLRLIKAQQLLMQARVNVNQAAQAVGYRSPTQFSRDYKRYFGSTPNQTRQQLEAS